MIPLNGVPPSISDGVLELVGMSNVTQLGLSHTAKLCGASDCVEFDRLTQAKAFKFKLVAPTFMQLDGEAWLQVASADHPTLVEVRRGNSVEMFMSDKEHSGLCL